MPQVFEVMKAVRNSDLPATARLVQLTLASLADPETGAIPERFTPSYTELSRMSGLSRASVVAQVNLLVERNWLLRTPPSYRAARQDRARNRYIVTFPASPGGGLVQEVDHSDHHETGTTSPGGGLGSPGAGLVLVQELDPTSPGGGHVVPDPSTSTTTTFSSSATPPKQKKAEPHRDDVDQICRHLAEKIADNGSERPAITADWRREARLLLDSKRTPAVTVDKAIALIDWCQNDTFWRPNIRSMKKFRAQYDALRLKALSEWERNRNPNARNGGWAPHRNHDDPHAFDGYRPHHRESTDDVA